MEKEINFEVSASDAIRLKWAYYLSCLALKQGYSVNHPGLVVFDEPGQQEIETASLIEFLRSCVGALEGADQAIVSTSENLGVVEDAVGPVANVVDFEGFILQPIASA